MDIYRFCHDHGIMLYESGRNIGPGFVGFNCPFCDDPSDHLGYNLYKNQFSCWRCGWKPKDLVISTWLRVSRGRARELIREYGGSAAKPKPDTSKLPAKELKYPTQTDQLQKHHRDYLRNRGFRPNVIAKEWGILGTGPMSVLDKIDYSYRILAPIYWNGQIVSFQARDITGQAKVKYKACPKEREQVHHQHVLYSSPRIKLPTDLGIIVEGFTDAWRLGPLAHATFGIEITSSQLRVLAKSFKRIVFVFDEELWAQQAANEAIGELRFNNVDARNITIKQDPGSLSDDEAEQLTKEVKTNATSYHI